MIESAMLADGTTSEASLPSRVFETSTAANKICQNFGGLSSFGESQEGP